MNFLLLLNVNCATLALCRLHAKKILNSQSTILEKRNVYNADIFQPDNLK